MLIPGKTMVKHIKRMRDNIKKYISPPPKRAKGKKNTKEMIYRVYQKRIRENSNGTTK